MEENDDQNDDVLDDVEPVASTSSVRRPIWKETDFPGLDHPEVDVSDRTNVEVRSPLEYFNDYFNDDFFEKAVDFSSRYHLLKNGKLLNTTVPEMKKLFGIHIIMGCIPYPRIHMYWNKKYRQESIAPILTRDRFFLLRSSLHFVDTVTPQSDHHQNKLWKVQPVIDAVRKTCLSLERAGRTYSIDEQMIPFTGRCPVRQFVRNKPRPTGLKNFVVASSSGLVVDFEIYQGPSTPLPNRELGLGPGVILRLAQTLPRNSCLYFDRYFTTLALLEKLAQIGFHGTGTIMANRLRGLKLKPDKLMQQGDHQQLVNENIALIKWRDTKTVLIGSNCTGAEPLSTVTRWNKSTKTYATVRAPQIIKKYNKLMGGVDICDQLMECYRTWIKTKKWTLKTIIHLLDLVLVNSWLLYREELKKTANKKPLDLLNFRLEVGEALTTTPERKRKSPEDLNQEKCEHTQNKQYKPVNLPVTDRRYDGYDHLAIFDDNIVTPRICRMENCKSRTKILCEKCKTYLCLSRNKHCFKLFHTKSK